MDWIKSWFPRQSSSQELSQASQNHLLDFRNVAPSSHEPASSNSQNSLETGSSVLKSNWPALLNSNNDVKESRTASPSTSDFEYEGHPTGEMAPMTSSQCSSAIKTSYASQTIYIDRVPQSRNKKPRLDSNILPDNQSDFHTREEDTWSVDENLTTKNEFGIA